MRVHLNRGLDLRVAGQPAQRIDGRLHAPSVALVMDDYIDVRAQPCVEVGDAVRAGEALASDRADPRILFTAPVSGLVREIRRGRKRRITHVVIERPAGDADAVARGDNRATQVRRTPGELGRAGVVDALLNSGLWTALRARPYERIASPDITPRAVFITAIDTYPLAPDPQLVIADREQDFLDGTRVLSMLTDGPTWVCTAAGAGVPVEVNDRVRHVEFAGPHPAGLPGTHMHALGPAMGARPDLWHVGYQDVLAIGRFFADGRLDRERVVALAGPGATRPRLVRLDCGASLSALDDECTAPGCRLISGSLLHGRATAAFLGRYDRQVTVLPPDAQAAARSPAARGGFPWPWLLRRRQMLRAAGERGPAGAMLPLERFEEVWPYRTPPLAVLRALLIGDPDDAVRLGVRGLAEDDLALCAYVCAGRNDYAQALRRTLRSIEQFA